MDQCTRRIIGFGVHAGVVDGIALCRMFNQAIRGCRAMPKYLSSDHDPLYRFRQWQANLRILEVAEIKTVPYVPLSHPFVERLIGTIRRECLDRTLFWTIVDLENKLLEFRNYFNSYRAHHSLGGENTKQERTTTGRGSEVLSMAISLSRLVPDTHRCLSLRRLSLLLSGVNSARLHVRKSFIVSVEKREVMG
jgi:hypothetical protein